ncbi:hypothetical protein F5884DRAFT_192394 [Xylogone sp. PMI_703]|nr:hypothetical protein F5884DRAFT_192394 [Xylogone sp. PMI_703]
MMPLRIRNFIPCGSVQGQPWWSAVSTSSLITTVSGILYQLPYHDAVPVLCCSRHSTAIAHKSTQHSAFAQDQIDQPATLLSTLVRASLARCVSSHFSQSNTHPGANSDPHSCVVWSRRRSRSISCTGIPITCSRHRPVGRGRAHTPSTPFLPGVGAPRGRDAAGPSPYYLIPYCPSAVTHYWPRAVGLEPLPPPGDHALRLACNHRSVRRARDEPQHSFVVTCSRLKGRGSPDQGISTAFFDTPAAEAK